MAACTKISRSFFVFSRLGWDGANQSFLHNKKKEMRFLWGNHGQNLKKCSFSENLKTKGRGRDLKIFSRRQY